MEIPMNLALAPWFRRAPAPAITRRPVASAGPSSQLLHKNATLDVRNPMGVTVLKIQANSATGGTSD
jgi:hypothetical protein